MKLTLKSLQAQMHNSFGEMSIRIDNLDTNLNERIDRILLNFEGYKKETDSNFRTIDERFDDVYSRFDDVYRRFDEVDRRFDEVDKRFDRLPIEIAEAFSPFFHNIEKMLSNHEDRITVLEKRH